MNDLISRQEAIDQIECLMDDKTKVHYNHGCADAIATLKNLPPAQRWVPVTERLPEMDSEDDDYFVSGGGRTWLCEFIACAGMWNDYPGNPDIVAWMPRPEPYEEVKE